MLATQLSLLVSFSSLFLFTSLATACHDVHCSDENGNEWECHYGQYCGTAEFICEGTATNDCGDSSAGGGGGGGSGDSSESAALSEYEASLSQLVAAATSEFNAASVSDLVAALTSDYGSYPTDGSDFNSTDDDFSSTMGMSKPSATPASSASNMNIGQSATSPPVFSPTPTQSASQKSNSGNAGYFTRGEASVGCVLGVMIFALALL